jgi:hypothetical protein
LGGGVSLLLTVVNKPLKMLGFFMGFGTMNYPLAPCVWVLLTVVNFLEIQNEC